MFFGINVGAGCASYVSYNDYNNRKGVALTGGLDLAFPIGRRFNIGAFVSSGYDWATESQTVELGPLFLINTNAGGSLYFGGGYTAWTHNHRDGYNARIGYKFRNGLNLFCNYLSYKYIDSAYAVTLNNGYSF